LKRESVALPFFLSGRDILQFVIRSGYLCRLL
jgi:hypothetical protein